LWKICLDTGFANTLIKLSKSIPLKSVKTLSQFFPRNMTFSTRGSLCLQVVLNKC